MGRTPWLRTKAIREIERKLGEGLAEYLTRRVFDDGETPAAVYREMVEKGVDMSCRMVYYYVRRIETDMHRGA